MASSDDGGAGRVPADMVASLTRTVRALDLTLADTPWDTGPPVELATAYRREFGAIGRIIVHGGEVIAGHEHVTAALAESIDAEVAVLDLTDIGPRERVLAVVVGERRQFELTARDDEALAHVLLMIRDYDDALLDAAGWNDSEIDELLETLGVPGLGGGRGGPTLADVFVAPPFTVLDGRQGYWRERRAEWLSYGMRPELHLAESGEDGYSSVFDPVLCELMYRWFTPSVGSRILDPFAGGSMRGAVASILQHQYVGVEPSADQVEANRTQTWVWEHAEGPEPVWHVGDAVDAGRLVGGGPFDLLFTHLGRLVESYSPAAAERTLSGLGEACSLLDENRFAVVVVAEVRDRSTRGGPYVGLVADTVRALEGAGLSYYGQFVLVSSAGTLPVRAARHFQASRKVGRVHQDVVVAYRGDLGAVGDHFPAVELPDECFSDSPVFDDLLP